MSGDLAGARLLYRRVGDTEGTTAEAAWLAIARMELAAGHTARAREALSVRERRFGRGALAAEALWIGARVERQAGNVAAARDLAHALTREHPGSPQAAAARAWLAGPGTRPRAGGPRGPDQ